MPRTTRSVGFILLLLIVACGGPSDPSDLPGPDIVHITIMGPERVNTGTSATYTATVTRGDGSEEPGAPAWSSSNLAVATIDSAGGLTSFSHGTTTITARQQTVSQTKLVFVTNRYIGTWEGTYRINVCTQSGAFTTARWCQRLGGVGAVLPATLVVQQGGQGNRQARGLLTLGSFGVNLNDMGAVTDDGRLTLAGSSNATANGVSFTITVTGWDTALDGRTVMVGRWTQDLAATSGTGAAHMENEIVTMNRTLADVRADSVLSH